MAEKSCGTNARAGHRSWKLAIERAVGTRPTYAHALLGELPYGATILWCALKRVHLRSRWNGLSSCGCDVEARAPDLARDTLARRCAARAANSVPLRNFPQVYREAVRSKFLRCDSASKCRDPSFEIPSPPTLLSTDRMIAVTPEHRDAKPGADQAMGAEKRDSWIRKFVNALCCRSPICMRLRCRTAKSRSTSSRDRGVAPEGLGICPLPHCTGALRKALARCCYRCG